MTGHLIHVVGPLERWDSIAWQYYGDAYAYGSIIDANRALFTDPLQAVPPVPPFGMELKIPIIDMTLRARPEDLPPWLR